MSVNPAPPKQRILLHPGDHRVSREAVVMGMNHFLLPARDGSKDTSMLNSETGRYGIQAMEMLINGLLGLGAWRSRLRAKASGGGNVVGNCSDRRDGFGCVSKANVRFVREFLEQDGIPLLAADLGGNCGRQIHFSGDDYSVNVRKIDTGQGRALVEQERHYWRDSMQLAQPAQADFW